MKTPSPQALEWLALLLIAVGIGLWSVAAGLVVAGVLLLLEANFGGTAQADKPDEPGEEADGEI